MLKSKEDTSFDCHHRAAHDYHAVPCRPRVLRSLFDAHYLHHHHCCGLRRYVADRTGYVVTVLTLILSFLARVQRAT
jgi:hypothetical protein